MSGPTPMPPVTAIIPAYNAAGTIAATLASVRAQTYPALEIVVVDDGSTDETASLVAQASREDARIQLIGQVNGGVAAARNAAIAAATGDWVAPVDADDIWHPRKIELQMRAALSAAVRPGFVYCWSRRIDAQNVATVDLGCPVHRGRVFEQLFASNFLKNASSALMRRDAVEAAGGFDVGLQAGGAQGAEDLKMYLAIAKVETVEVAPAFLTGYRMSAQSMSQAPTRMRRSIELVLEEVERDDPDLPVTLSNVARMNYDLYAAALSFWGRDLPGFARYVFRGVRHAPGPAMALLFCNAVWRVSLALRVARAPRAFLDLDPQERLPMPLADWFLAHQTRTVVRASAVPVTRDPARDTTVL